MSENSNTVLGSLLGSAVLSALISGGITYYGNIEVERFKQELADQSTITSKQIAAYQTLITNLTQYHVALDRYVRVCENSARNPNNRSLKDSAGLDWNETSNLMADVYATLINDVDPDIRKRVDETLLRPVSLNLSKVQQKPDENPELVKLYESSLKQNFDSLKSEIRAKAKSIRP